MHNKIHVFALTATLMISGCHATLHPEPPVSPEAVSIQFISPQNVPDTVRLSTKVDYSDGLNNKRVVGQDLIISAQAPGYMRITISAFDKAISTLVTDGNVFALMDVTNNTFVAGNATPENISQILPVFLSASDLYKVICGGFPTDGVVEDSSQDFAWDPVENGYRRTLEMKDGASLNVFYKYPEGNIFKITVKKQDTLSYQYTASDFIKTDSGWSHPKTILFSLPEYQTNVRLRVEKTETDVQFSDSVFKLRPPEGAKMLILK